MNEVISLGLAFIGFMIGLILFAGVGRWFVAVYEVARDRNADAKAARLTAAVFLSSGPWLLAVVIGVGYSVAGESWAIWIFGGICAAIVFISLLSVYLARKARSQNAKPAA